MGNPHKSKQDINALLDEFAAHQQKLINMEHVQRISLEEMYRIVDVMSTWHISENAIGRPVKTMEDLVSLVRGGYGAFNNEFFSEMFPLVKEFIALALEANGDEWSIYKAQDVRKMQGYGGKEYFDLQNIIAKSGLAGRGIFYVGKKIVSHSNQQAQQAPEKRNLEQKINEYLEQNVEEKDRAEMRRFLMGEWYNPNKNQGNVSQLKNAHEAKTSQVAVETEVDATNSNQEKRKFTAKQLSAVNQIYGEAFRSWPEQSSHDVLRKAANIAANADAPRILGNADRSINTSPEATDTEVKVREKQSQLFQEQPDIKDKIKASVVVNKATIAPDVKTLAGFWKGVKSFLNKLENPFKKWQEKREEKARNKVGPSM